MKKQLKKFDIARLSNLKPGDRFKFPSSNKVYEVVSVKTGEYTYKGDTDLYERVSKKDKTIIFLR